MKLRIKIPSPTFNTSYYKAAVLERKWVQKPDISLALKRIEGQTNGTFPPRPPKNSK